MTIYAKAAPTDNVVTGVPAPRGTAVVTRHVDRLSFFSLLWGVFLTLHLLSTYWAWFQFSRKADLLLGAAALAAALFLLLRPSSLSRLTLAAAAFVAYKLYLVPHLANHIFLATFMSASVVVVVGPSLLRRRSPLAAEDRDAIAARLAPVLAAEVLVMYFFVVLHKLNWDYLNPQVSCGFILYREISAHFGGLLPAPDFFGYPCLIGALILEAAIFVLLLIPRTRVLAIGIGLVFHAMLSLHHNLFIYGYTALLYASYVLFLPPAYIENVRAWWSHKRSTLPTMGPRRAIMLLAGVLVLLGLAAALSVALVGRAETIRLLHAAAPPAVRTLFFAYAAVLIVLYFQMLRRHREPAPPFDLWRGLSLPLAILPALLVFNGMSPYLGLKTGTSFAMFSNLRTEGPQSNHLFMPNLRLRGEQDDLVHVVASNAPEFRLPPEQRWLLPTFEVRRKLHDGLPPKTFVELERNGARYRLTAEELTAAAQDPAVADLVRAPSWLEQRLLHYRAVTPHDEPMCCSH